MSISVVARPRHKENKKKCEYHAQTQSDSYLKLHYSGRHKATKYITSLLYKSFLTLRYHHIKQGEICKMEQSQTHKNMHI